MVEKDASILLRTSRGDWITLSVIGRIVKNAAMLIVRSIAMLVKHNTRSELNRSMETNLTASPPTVVGKKLDAYTPENTIFITSRKGIFTSAGINNIFHRKAFKNKPDR